MAMPSVNFDDYYGHNKRERERKKAGNPFAGHVSDGVFGRANANQTRRNPGTRAPASHRPQTDRAAMVSDSELVERLQEVLRSSDLNTTTTAALRRRLEEDFGADLSHKKAFIREQVDLFLSEVAAKAEPEEPEEAAVPKEEEPEVEPEEGEGEGEEEEGEGEEEEEEDDDGDSGGARKKQR